MAIPVPNFRITEPPIDTQTTPSIATAIEVRPEVHDDYAERLLAEISQLVWAHPSIKHSHYKNPDGKVFTLSPWSIDAYWEMTRHLDPEDYVLA